MTVVFVEGQSYINVYANEITDYVNQVNRNESSLIELKNEIQIQKEFYEFILDNLPADIAVFDTSHRYVYINPQGIKDDKIRSYMIGKMILIITDLKNYLMTRLVKEERYLIVLWQKRSSSIGLMNSRKKMEVER